MNVKTAPRAGAPTPQLALEQAANELRAGNPVAAEQTLRQALLHAPRAPRLLGQLAEIVANHGRPQEAIVLLNRSLAAAPAAHPLRIRLARLHESQNELARALFHLEQLPPEVRGTLEIGAFEAALLGTLGLHDREIAIYQQLVRVAPKLESLWMSLGNSLKTVGRTDEAVAALRHAIKVRPTYGEAYWSLANLKTFRFDKSDLAAMRKALHGKLDKADALHFNFALGKALEDRDDYEASFGHYDEGNRIRAADLAPNTRIVSPIIDAAIATYDSALYAKHAGDGCQSEEPIFVVGLQRSGSTLVEQILASHPEIEGTAELLAMQQIWENLARAAQRSGRGPFQQVRELDAAQLTALGEEYLARTRPYRRTDRPRFVDKLPANWMNAGFIRLILPKARIIDARRFPLACGFSNFKQHYATGVTFAYSQESIGTFYRDYLRMMRHMDVVQPGAIHRVINEALIDDPEGEVRKLLQFVGVPWDPACLAFDRNTRAVHSASAEQVRRPINRDGVDYWRHYEQWLGPLKATLGSAIDDWRG